MLEPFVKATAILKKLHSNGYEAYFVGGSVRDYLLKRPIGDIDIATSALPEEVMQIFPKTIDVGASHGTVIVLYKNEQYEVTTFRTEENYDDFRRPSQVEFVTSLQEDLKRRDFTMNAIAMTSNGEIVDPFDGTKAIRDGLIQTVGDPSERFSEDALRMMRAIRFVSQLSFTLCEETKQAIAENVFLLKNISVERITIEYEKLLRGPNCQSAITIMLDTLLYKYLPDFNDKKDGLQSFSEIKWNALQDRAEFWTLTCYLLKIDNIDSFLRKWKLPKNIIVQVTLTSKNLLEVSLHGWTNRLLFECGEVTIQQVERIIDVLGRNQEYSSPIDRYKKLPIKTRSDIVISGQDLIAWCDEKPGKWISELFIKIEDAILDNKVENNKQKIKEWLLSCNQK